MWTSERIEQLLDLKKQGMTFTEIAAAIGLTKGQVSGKLHRLGACDSREAEYEKRRQRRAVRKARAIKARLATGWKYATRTRNGKTFSYLVPPARRQMRRPPPSLAQFTLRDRPQTLAGHQFGSMKNVVPAGTYIDLQDEHPPTEISFLDVRPNQCRWPTSGDRLTMMCCGAERFGSYPYCQAHYDRACDFQTDRATPGELRRFFNYADRSLVKAKAT